jgi:hypothetical protein
MKKILNIIKIIFDGIVEGRTKAYEARLRHRGIML